MTPRFTRCLLSLTVGGHLLAPGVRFPGSDRHFTCGLCHHCHRTGEQLPLGNGVPRVTLLVRGVSGLQTRSAGSTT